MVAFQQQNDTKASAVMLLDYSAGQVSPVESDLCRFQLTPLIALGCSFPFLRCTHYHYGCIRPILGYPRYLGQCDNKFIHCIY